MSDLLFIDHMPYLGGGNPESLLYALDTVGGRDLQHSGGCEPPSPLDYLNAGFAQEDADAAYQLPNDARLSRLDGRPVWLYLAFEPQAISLCVL